MLAWYPRANGRRGTIPVDGTISHTAASVIIMH